jgi:hypothetical protein
MLFQTRVRVAIAQGKPALSMSQENCEDREAEDEQKNQGETPGKSATMGRRAGAAIASSSLFYRLAVLQTSDFKLGTTLGETAARDRIAGRVPAGTWPCSPSRGADVGRHLEL